MRKIFLFMAMSVAAGCGSKSDDESNDDSSSEAGDTDADVHAIMTHLNAMLEAWIRRRPEQWFWVHRRWPD